MLGSKVILETTEVYSLDPAGRAVKEARVSTDPITHFDARTGAIAHNEERMRLAQARRGLV